jgi:hypothetical protein
MGLSVTRQKQLLDLFNTLVEKCVGALGYREKALEALKSRPAFKAWNGAYTMAERLRKQLEAEIEKCNKEMAKMEKGLQHATGGKVSIADFMGHLNDPVNDPKIDEFDGALRLVTEDRRAYRSNGDENYIVDREPIGPPEFHVFIEGLRADLKLSLTERELVAALTEAKGKINEFMKDHK